jgi:hypothetical protein
MSDKKVILEDSKLWQLSTDLAARVRSVVATVPHEEHYVFTTPAIQNITIVTSDIAYIVGKDVAASPYDYQAARGHLLTAKGLVLMASELQFVDLPKTLLADFDKLQALIEKELARVEKTQEEKEK